MSVVYFTNNASTGAGSLVEAIKNASPGDVVRPDETVFERGSTIEIVLAAALNVNKDLTLDASPFRVRLDGGESLRCAVVASGVDATFVNFDFCRGQNANSGGGINAPGAAVTLRRCGFYGCSGRLGGGIYATGALSLYDCVVVGCRATGSGGGLYFANGATLNGVTVAGCVAATSGDSLFVANGACVATNAILCGAVGNPQLLKATGSIVDVASSEVGFVASPPDDLSVETWNADAWQDWDLRLLDDASPNPSPYRDSGDVGEMSQYDLQGNFRGRETNGAASCSPGAYETIQADLFWVGRDATGAEVVSSSFLTSDGWAASRFADVSGDVAPQAGQTLFIGRDVAFVDAAPANASVSVGAYAVTIPEFNGALTVGRAYGVAVAGTVNALKIGDYAQITTSGATTLPVVDYGGDGATVDANPVDVFDGVFFADAAAPATITFSSGGGWADTRADVAALDADPLSATSVSVKITKNNAELAAFAQSSDDDGATWRTVETTADVDEYELTVAQGADVAVRVATATGWLTDTVSTAPFLPVWTVSNAFESVTGVVNAFEVATGGSNDGLNVYDFNDYGYL